MKDKLRKEREIGRWKVDSKDRWRDEWMDGLTDGQTEKTDELTNGQTYRWT